MRQPSTRTRRLYAMLNIVVLAAMLFAQAAAPLAASQETSRPSAAAGDAMRATAPQITPGSPDDLTGLDMTLSQGAAQPEEVITRTVAATEPLTPAETQALLARLPQLEQQVEDETGFRLPPDSLRPPTSADTVETTFPPTATAVLTDAVQAGDVTSGDLEVTRYAPEGPIAMAPFLQVTFSQPMVPLGTLAQLSAEDVPVTITPELPGTWRWLGTQTLTFEYASDEFDRFPMATEYTAEIAAGTTSATGGELQESVRWSFSTPPPSVVTSHPNGGPTARDPIMFVAFDQLIDPAAVLEALGVTANGEEVDVRLAAEEEVAADPRVTALAKQAGEGRWLALRATSELPADATINVNVGAGTPSAEGPLLTEKVQSFSFFTYGPLRIVDGRCAWGGTRCAMGSPFLIEFNNPLDAQAVTNEWVTVTPELPGMRVSVYGRNLEIMGQSAGRTEYEVIIHTAVRDIFGQTLDEEVTFDFETDSGYPYLTSNNGPLVTVDPAGDPVYTVYSLNYPRLHVRMYAVTPDDWQRWMTYQREYWNTDRPTPPGELVYEEMVSTGGANDTLTETVIDLREGLGDRTKGHLLVIVDIPRPLFGEQDRTVVQSWVQVTEQAIDAFSDRQTLLAWVTRLADGTPVEGADIELYGTSEEDVTAADGTATFELSTRAGYLLVSTWGQESEFDGVDVAILPRNQYDYWSGSGWQKTDVRDELRWYVVTDRNMYRPGEEVHFKGILRRVGMTPTGDVGLIGDTGQTVRYTVSDPQGSTLAEGVAEINDMGGFDFVVELAENVNLGYANVYLNANGISNVAYYDYYSSFQIQEFRRPEFAVSAQAEEMGPFYLTESAELSVSAQYYAGGPLSGADTTWNVSASASSYTPPNWEGFTFGVWTPWWGWMDTYATSEFGGDFGRPMQANVTQTLTGTTDATGKHYLDISFNRASEPRPYTVSANAVVMDVNRQAWSATTNLLVHPSEYYVGLRSETTFVEAGIPLAVEVIVTDVDGNAIPERAVLVQAARQEWNFVGGRWLKQDAAVQECVLATSNEPETCTFETGEGGEYRIWAEVRDDQERLNRSQFTRWVSGGRSVPARNVTQEEVLLVPDKESYVAGDVAFILVQPPFVPAEGLLTVARNGILYTERFQIEEGSMTVEVPIEEAYVPGITVLVDLTGSAPRLDDKGEEVADLPERPAFARGQLSLDIPPVNRTLTVDLEPAAEALEPGVETSLDLVVTDATGAPVENAELLVVVVDEAILALTGYEFPDPLLTFYRSVGGGIDSVYARNTVVLVDPAALAQSMMGGMGGGGDAEAVMDMAAAPAPAAAVEESAAEMPQAMATAAVKRDGDTVTAQSESGQQAGDTPIEVRTDFNPLAVFAPAVRTDADGQATVEYKLPDNLTRYRVMVVAATERDFGSADANITARLPLMVRPSAPRFLNFGDVFEFPVVIQNQTDEATSVAIAMTTTNILLAEEVGQRVEIPANDRVEVRFAAASESAGTGRFQIAVAVDDFADAAGGEMPVYTPATTEAFATYGVVDAGAISQPLRTPEDVFPQFGGLEVSTSSTALSELTDAMLYLQAYPYECSEQLASRVLSVASLRDVLTAFQAENLPSPQVMDDAMARDITRLVSFQNVDGGFPVWERGKPSIPYYSIYVTHALQVARSKDYAVPDATLDAARDHLRNIESYYPDWYSAVTKRTLSAYAVYVRDLMGDTDAAKARALVNEIAIEDHSLESLGWLWQVLSGDASSEAELEAIRTHVNNRAVENASSANFFTSYGDQEWVLLHSNRRTDAILLDAMINDDPENPLIPKIVNGLMAARINGRWNNTQENTFVLLALDRYFNTFENVEPDFVARVWLGETYVAEHLFEGYDATTQQTTVPMQYIMDAETDPDLTVAKDGEGRLYYRLGLSYAPTDLNLDPLDMGFVVQRTYEAVDNPDDVTRDDEGVWHIKAGARVRIRVEMVTQNRRYHVALVDPLPAGLEPINPALAISEPAPRDQNPIARPYGWWWYATWYEHENLRDSRAEAFATVLWDGVYEYRYIARATTPGTFVAPPAKAEEMYTPEVFGRSGSDWVVVE